MRPHEPYAYFRGLNTWVPACMCGCIQRHNPAWPDGPWYDNAADAVEHARQLLHDAEHGPAL